MHSIRPVKIQLIAILCILSSATFSPSSLAQSEISVGTSKTGLLMWLAEANGYFSSDNITVNVEEVGSGIVSANRVADGSLMFGTSSEFALTSKVMAGADLCIYGTISASRTTRLISRSDMVGTTADDLRGKRVAVTPNGIAQYFLSQFFLLSGVDERDVTLVAAEPAEIVDLILSGDVEAAITWEPHVTAIRAGLGDIATEYLDQSDQYFFFVLHGRCTLDDDAMAGLSVLLNGLVRAHEFAREAPDDAKQILAKRLNLSEAAIERIWPQHSLHVSLGQDLLTAIESEAHWRIDNGVSTGVAPNPLDFVRTAPLRAVKESAVRIIE